MQVLLILFGVGLLLFMVYWIWLQNKPVYKVPSGFPGSWRELLEKHVHFYQNLNKEEKERFEKDIRRFLKTVRITGIRVEVTDFDRLLVAAGAVIPLFGFAGWNYNFLHEVLLSPSSFDRTFSMKDPKEIITGMVGSGRNMEGVMILSKSSLEHGFKNTMDKQNVAIHEFVHILDKQDGKIDGIPGELNYKEYARPWLQLMHREMNRIKKGKSDIDNYAGTSEEEFLAVVSEYFFERPGLFQSRHPELYKLLEKVYHQNLVSVLKKPFKV